MDELWRRETFNKYLELRGREEDEAVYARLEVLEIIQEMGEVDELINYIFDKYVRDEGRDDRDEGRDEKNHASRI